MDHLVIARRRRKSQLMVYINKNPDFFDENNKEKHICIIADSLGVSASKIKEYLKELEATGFIEKKPMGEEQGVN